MAKHPPNRQTKTAKHPPETINYQCDNGGKASTMKEGDKASTVKEGGKASVRRRPMQSEEMDAIRRRQAQKQDLPDERGSDHH